MTNTDVRLRTRSEGKPLRLSRLRRLIEDAEERGAPGTALVVVVGNEFEIHWTAE